jgi:type I restriction enzyme S subunit
MSKQAKLDAFMKEDVNGNIEGDREGIQGPYDLPEGWKWVRLRDIAKTTSGGTPSRYVKEYWEKGTIPWVKSGELEDNIIYDTEEKITEEGLKNSNAKLFPKGTLLVAMYGATVGKTAILSVDAATNQAVCAIFPNNAVVIRDYIRYYIIYRRGELVRRSFGGAQPNISQAVIRNILLPLPPLEEQKRIVSRLEQLISRAEEAKRLRKLARKEAEKMIQAALNKVFSKAEEKWGLVKLTEMCKINPSKNEIKHLPDDAQVTFVPMTAVNEITGEIEKPEIRLLGEVKKGYTYFREGDVLFAKITPCMENGKSAIAKHLVNGIGFGSTEFHILRPIKGKAIPEWIHFYIRQKTFREEAARNMTGSVGQQRVPVHFLKSVKIPFAPIEEQKKLVSYLSRIKSFEISIDKLQQKTEEELEKLIPAILDKAFKGEL